MLEHVAAVLAPCCSSCGTLARGQQAEGCSAPKTEKFVKVEKSLFPYGEKKPQQNNMLACLKRVWGSQGHSLLGSLL